MQDFVIGQRWINDAELQLGLGTVLEVETRIVTLLFQATGENRSYSRQTAPLTRITFSSGDTIRSRDGLNLVVDSVSETDGLVTYMGRDANGKSHELDEILLDYHLQLNRPSERLLSGQIDNDKWYSLRIRSLLELNRLGHSTLRGLAGCRVSLIPHQLYIAHEVSRRYAPRVLLADEVGLGKTIEAGLILHQQIMAESAQRVLIVVPESLVHQWFVEMLRRFNLHFSIFDEERHQTIAEHEGDRNPFHAEQLILCSLKFLSDNKEILDDAVAGDWDLLVVDEAHHLQWTQEKASVDYQAIEQLAAVTAGVLLLTATPEQLGKTGHFARLRLLDPSRFHDFDSFIEEEMRYEPVADAIENLFSDSPLEPNTRKVLSTNLEESEKTTMLLGLIDEGRTSNERADAKNELIDFLLDRHGTGRVLFRNTRSTIEGFPQRKLFAYPLPQPTDYEGLPFDKTEAGASLSPERLHSDSSTLTSANWVNIDPRVSWLQDKLFQLASEKILIITATASTALELAEALRMRAGIHIAVFHEQMSIVERDRAAAYFADEDERCQALLCSEIGSEGRNFQFAHHLILFDLPLNPDLLEQRIGRLDRIGQSQTINIHVPYLQNSAQAVMFRWLNEALDAFIRPCPAGPIVFNQMYDRLLEALSTPAEQMDKLLRDTQLGVEELDRAMHRGRDRLLEYNSCRPALAESLKQQATAEDDQSSLPQYMDDIFDCFGVHSEEQSSKRYILSPGEHMLTAFPQLPDDGMTVTYDRAIALSNEHIHYLSWDHPMVTGAMDIVLSSELGNTSLIAIEHAEMEAGALLLESIYIYESASSQSLHTSRYLPPTIIRIVINEQGSMLEAEIQPQLINRCMLPVDRETGGKIVRAKADELKRMTKLSEDQANLRAPAILEKAHKRATQLLTKETDRLQTLSKVNPNIRSEEIEYFETQLQTLDSALDAASLRLDAMRVIITT